MQETKIQWTDLSVNPIRAKRKDGTNRIPGHFCQKIGAGCAHCYASKTQPRFGLPMFPGTDKSAAEMGVNVFLDDAQLHKVLRRRKPAKIFWCDMSDMFGDWVPFEWIDRCFATMFLTPHLTHQILTKRPARMAEYLQHVEKRGLGCLASAKKFGETIRVPKDWPLPNVWLGTSCENQQTADERILHLLKCPAAVRFISAEPLLSGIDFSKWINPVSQTFGTLTQKPDAITWMIVGGESGAGARPCNVEWIRSIVKQCKAAGVNCFVKQVGKRVEMRNDTCSEWGRSGDVLSAESDAVPDHTPYQGEEEIYRLENGKGGDPDEWPEDLRVRQMPTVTVTA